MKKSIAVAAVAAAVMTAGTATAFAAQADHTVHADRTMHAAPVKLTETSTINKFVWGPYLIIVRYAKDDPLPKRFNVPLTLRAGAERSATAKQLAVLQRSYLPVAQGSIQVLVRQVDPKAVKHVQRHQLHAHAHVNTGFGGEARQVARHFPYTHPSKR